MISLNATTNLMQKCPHTSEVGSDIGKCSHTSEIASDSTFEPHYLITHRNESEMLTSNV